MENYTTKYASYMNTKLNACYLSRKEHQNYVIVTQDRSSPKNSTEFM